MFHVVCFKAVLTNYLQHIFPNMLQGYMYKIAGFDVYASWVAIGVGFAVLLVILNIIGIKKAAIFQKILTAIIAIVGILLFIASMFSGSIDNFSSQLFSGNDFGGAFNNIIKVAMITPFFFFGFDVIPQASEENINQRK